MQRLNGFTVLITAGPTIEPIDPVRFIGNFSTGKMGYALAEAFAHKGARVLLVSGPTQMQAVHPRIEVTRVRTAQQMYEAVAERAAEAQIMVFAAAVADYRPKEAAVQKIKKDGQTLTIELVKNVDIAAEMGNRKRPDQFLVGFALETENEEANARQKLLRKNLDLIVLNSLQDPGAGFAHDTNRIRILDHQKTLEFPLKTKKEVAHDIVAAITARLHV